jgi:hypothetical protein
MPRPSRGRVEVMLAERTMGDEGEKEPRTNLGPARNL